MIATLNRFWAAQGCAILEPYDMEVGAGTFHPTTTLYCLGPKPWRFAHVQPCRRPSDGRYGENPNRMQRFHQYQVVLKPSPDEALELFLQSLKEIGLGSDYHDIRLVEDDWESPTVGASGLGWEVWCDGMEVAQITYMQYLGGIECYPVTIEFAYGLDRLAMFVQGCNNINDIAWNTPKDPEHQVFFRDLFLRSEREFSEYYLELSDTDILLEQFKHAECEAEKLLARALPLPAYDMCIKASHLFNQLNARGVLSVTERASYIARVRTIAKGCCQAWVEGVVVDQAENQAICEEA
jgi:glycyl-tRNA synthetase alpha chain